MNDSGKTASEQAYDSMPYPSVACRETHPDFIEANARLFGFEAAPPETCRMLEIGCGTGVNLMAMAETLPSARFVGFDLSGVQIEFGKSIAKSVGLDNVYLEHLDVRNTPDDMGLFDYIVCHGVYSWVPQEVRSSLLQAIRRHLAPNGLAFVSYNTMPGWFSRGVIRDMMAFHTDQFESPFEKVQQARHLLDFLAHCAPEDQPHYRAALHSEVELIQSLPDEYLYHEHLEADNYPQYFYQFVQHAEQNDLQYFGDAEIGLMWAGNRTELVNQMLQQLAPDHIGREQYYDFVANRTFRRSLLCRADKQFERDIKTSAIKNGFLSTTMKLESPVDLNEGAPLEIAARKGSGRVKTSDALTKAALAVICDLNGSSIAINELVKAVGLRLQTVGISLPAGAKAFDDVAFATLQLVLSGAVELCFRPPLLTRTVSHHPAVSPLNRILASQQRFTINRQHGTVELGPVLQRITVLLDGSNSIKTIIADLERMIATGQLQISEETEEKNVESMVKQKLDWLAQNSMLVS